MTFLGKGGFWIQNTSWEGKTRSDPFPFKARSFLNSGGAALGAE